MTIRNKFMHQTDCGNYQELSAFAAAYTKHIISKEPEARLGLPTGGTPVLMYKLLKESNTDFSRCHTFNLDEYIGLPTSDPRSYRAFMQDKLFSGINLPEENIHFLNGMVQDPESECRRYDEELNKFGPLSLQILGMGHNGHIGFNEPADSFLPNTHIQTLSPSTISANSRFFKDEKQVPKQALTMGVAPIMHAKRILLLICGEEKCALLEKALNGPVTPRLPVSLLLLHPDVFIIKCQQAPDSL